MMCVKGLQYQLEVGGSIVAVANVLVVFPPRLVPVDLHTDENVTQDPALGLAVSRCLEGGYRLDLQKPSGN